MKIVVCVKRVIDSTVRVRLCPNGQEVETQGVKMAMNPFDAIAVEAALQLKTSGVASEVIVVSLGGPDVVETLRHGLAMGADGGVHVMHQGPSLEPLTRAKILAALVRRFKPDLVLMGKQAIDDDASQTPPLLAGLLGWAQGTFASQITVAEDKATVQVQREVDQGLQTTTLTLPAVISTDLRLNEPRLATLPNIMKAKSKPLETLSVEDLMPCIPSPRVITLHLAPPPPRPVGIVVPDVATLVAHLTSAGVLK